jgi:hypothetical protein
MSLTWTEHPLIDLDPNFRRLDDGEFAALATAIGDDAALAYFEARETRIKNAQGYFLRAGKWVHEPDPLRYGVDLPHWPVIRAALQQKEEVYVFGGNDSAKTELLAKVVCEVLTGRLTWAGMMAGAPNILCVAQNDTVSKAVQQKKIYSYLPVEAQRLNDQPVKKRNSVSKINYSLDGGFTNGSFTLASPRGASCLFRNVTQFEKQELGIEGTAFHLIVVDESCPLALLETLRFRAAKAGGRILYCFTPIAGFDSVCNNVFTGARLLKSLPMQFDWRHGAESFGNVLGVEIRGGKNPEIQFPELDVNYRNPEAKTDGYVKGCPAGEMPFVMQPLDFNKLIVFTWSQWNPFPPPSKFCRWLPKIADKCVGRGSRTSLCRLFGFTDKLATSLIPNFRADYFPKGHLIRHAELVELLGKTPHNLRHAADPATARSWFQGWKAVLPSGVDDRPMQYLVWESPTVAEGEWVTPDGERGDGQKLFAEKQVDDYKLYIREIEASLGHALKPGQPDPVLRAGDPRGFAANMGDGASKYFELFLRDDSAKDPRLGPMIFRPADIKATVRADVSYDGKLMDLLACDWNRPIDATNRPHLLVSDACQNFIRCVLNCPVNEPDSPYKDGLDMGRYLFDAEIPYIPPAGEQAGNESGGAWQ